MQNTDNHNKYIYMIIIGVRAIKKFMSDYMRENCPLIFLNEENIH